jgi:4-hydroxy-3-methylbut-2-enyl diphosphate reductase
MIGLLICAPLLAEAAAVRRGLPARVPVTRAGYGPRRAAGKAARLPAFRVLAVAGLGGAVDPSISPGDVFVASEVRGGGRTVACPGAEPLAGELRRAGLVAHTGPLRTCARVVRGAERERLRREGVRCVDMESAPLAAAAGGRPLAVVRVIVDTPAHPLASLGTAWRGVAALRTLARVGPVLERWADALGAPPGEVRDE